MDVIEAIKSRHSIRKYKKEKLSRDLILEVLESARWAPSAHNFQPWKVYIVNEDDKIDKIAKPSKIYVAYNPASTILTICPVNPALINLLTPIN